MPGGRAINSMQREARIGYLPQDFRHVMGEENELMFDCYD